MTMDPLLVGDRTMQGYITTTANNLKELEEKGVLAQTTPLDFPIHSIQPGHYILLQCWRGESLEPRWEGQFLVLLTTGTAV